MGKRFRRQDLFALAGYFSGMAFAINRYYSLRRIPRLRIIALHDVLPNVEQRFAERVAFLHKHTNLMRLDDVFCGRMCWDRLNVVLSFDDGYKSWSSFVAPTLRRLDVPATFFVSSGVLGLRGDAARDFARRRLQVNEATTGFLAEGDLREIRRQGFDIGGHTKHHVDLGQLEEEEEAFEEISADKARLAQILSEDVRHFAYPFGRCDNGKFRLGTLLQKAGYTSAVTLIPGLNYSDSDRYKLSRDIASPEMPMSIFKARVLGGYEVVNAVRHRLGLPYEKSAWNVSNVFGALKSR